MKYLFALFLCLSQLHGSEVVHREKIVHWIEGMKIKFDNHTYIYFSNNWDAAGDTWFHDPDCERCRKKIMDIDLLKERK